MLQWERLEGGLVSDVRLERVNAIGCKLALQRVHAAVQFHVLENPALAAYAWPTGDVFVSTGLIGAASDDEIAAAIAHELGHLLAADAPPTGLAGIDSGGVAGSLAVEMRADRAGVGLLVASGRPAAALKGLLVKVRDSGISAAARADVQARIAALGAPAPR